MHMRHIIIHLSNETGISLRQRETLLNITYTKPLNVLQRVLTRMNDSKRTIEAVYNDELPFIRDYNVFD